MKRIMIVGAGIEQVPAIEMAKKMAYYVITSDISPDAPGIKLADKFHQVSTNDKIGNLKIAEKEKIDGILTLCSETAVPVVAYIAAKLGLPGISEETALAATNKGVMRKELQKKNIPVTGYSLINNEDEIDEFIKKTEAPWVLKPSDSSGQKGISLIQNKEELLQAYQVAKNFSSDKKVIIEEFAEGMEINVTCIAINGRVHVLSVSDRLTLPPPHFGIAYMHQFPSSLDEAETKKIKQLAIDSTIAIGIENGISYPQFISTSKGPKLLEIAARIPGGHMREVALYASGVDIIKAAIMQAAGENLSFESLITDDIHPALAVRFLTCLDFPQQKESISQIVGIKDSLKISGIKQSYIRLNRKDKIPNLTNSGGRFGAIISVGDSKNQVLEQLENAYKKIKIL